jgi:hypothetical protein
MSLRKTFQKSKHQTPRTTAKVKNQGELLLRFADYLNHQIEPISSGDNVPILHPVPPLNPPAPIHIGRKLNIRCLAHVPAFPSQI